LIGSFKRHAPPINAMIAEEFSYVKGEGVWNGQSSWAFLREDIDNIG